MCDRGASSFRSATVSGSAETSSMRTGVISPMSCAVPSATLATLWAASGSRRCRSRSVRNTASIRGSRWRSARTGSASPGASMEAKSPTAGTRSRTSFSIRGATPWMSSSPLRMDAVSSARIRARRSSASLVCTSSISRFWAVMSLNTSAKRPLPTGSTGDAYTKPSPHGLGPLLEPHGLPVKSGSCVGLHPSRSVTAGLRARCAPPRL